MPIPTLTPAPTAPSRSDPPATFIARFNAFLAWIVTFVTQMNASISAITTAVAGSAADAVQTALDRISTTASAAAAASSALTALNAPGTSATSVTAIDLSTLDPGDLLTIVIQTGKALSAGHTVVVARTALATTQFVATVMDYDSVTGDLDLSVDEAPTAGGNFAAWSIALTAKVVIPTASAAEIWAGTDTGKAITAAGESAADEIQTLADAATITWNVATQGRHAKVVLGGNRTLAQPTGMRLGKYYVFYPVQPGAGGPRLCALPANWDFGQQGTPVLSTGANKMDAVRLQCIDAATGACKATFVKAA